VDLLSIIALAMLAALDFESTRWPVLVVGSIVLGLLPLIHSSRVLGFVHEKSRRLWSDKLQSLVQRLLFLLNASASLLRSRLFYGGLVIGVLAWGAEGIGFYLILEYLGMPTSLLVAIGIYAISILVGAVSFLPGGLGSTEATMGLLLVLSGADPALALAATVACRVATLWFAIAIGMLVAGAIETRKWLLPRPFASTSGKPPPTEGGSV
jgi:uncharacterized protein (TIRG00374 family)